MEHPVVEEECVEGGDCANYKFQHESLLCASLFMSIISETLIQRPSPMPKLCIQLRDVSTASRLTGCSSIPIEPNVGSRYLLSKLEVPPQPPNVRPNAFKIHAWATSGLRPCIQAPNVSHPVPSETYHFLQAMYPQLEATKFTLRSAHQTSLKMEQINLLCKRFETSPSSPVIIECNWGHT